MNTPSTEKPSSPSTPDPPTQPQHPPFLTPLFSFSSKLASLSFRPTPFLLVPLFLYTLLYLGISYTERRISAAHTAYASSFPPPPQSSHSDDATSKFSRFPDTLSTYAPSYLPSFLTHLGPQGRTWYLLFLTLEIPFTSVLALLFSLTISRIAAPLADAEHRLTERHAFANEASELVTRKTTGGVRAVPVLLLNLLPIVAVVADAIENVVLACAVLMFRENDDQQIGWPARWAPRVTMAKWGIVRFGVALTGMSLLTGWLRILVFRLKAGEPLFGGGRGGNIDENMVMAEVMGKKGSKVAKPKGLSNLSGLSHETWKSGDGKGNRNKNRKKAQ